MTQRLTFSDKKEGCSCDFCSSICPSCQQNYTIAGEDICPACKEQLKTDEIRVSIEST